MIGKIIIPKPTTTKVIITKLMIMKPIMVKPPNFFKNYGSINHI
jgi:hypothetical protein